MADKITIDIDGRPCEAKPGEMIIAVADREGIKIPRFCYHAKLSIAANCRMCLVEAEQGGRPFPKPVPACATPVGEGMKVQTRSPKALEAQRGTMEFLLINHPLDCPICDQGGECELQDVSMGYGGDLSRFSEQKRVVKDENLGSLIATEMTRCIHCTRCVRFCAEIAGVRELGATGRGEDMRIGTFVETAVNHELAGNVIDLCPVGALTSKPYRYQARAWELTAHDSIAPHDGLGSHITLNVRRGQVLRVHPRPNEAINETWLADRDRFSYQGLNSPARLTQPLIKRDGQWHEIEWFEALQVASVGLKSLGGETLGCLISPQSTLEELYLAQKLIRALGGNHIDSRLRQQDFRAASVEPTVPWLGLPIAELEQQQTLLVIGSDIRQEQPLLAHRIRKAALAGATVVLVNSYRLELNHSSLQLIAPPGCQLLELAAIIKALGGSAQGAVAQLIDQAEVTENHQKIAEALRTGESGAVLLGALALADPHWALLEALAHRIAEISGARIGYLSAAANSVGAYVAGALPHRGAGAQTLATPGRNALAMLTEPLRGYLLWGLDPDYDLINPSLARSAFKQADFVVAASAFRTPGLEAAADLLLPIAAFSETAGTFINSAADWQRFQGAVAPPGEARPGWKLLRVLGNQLELDGFDYTSARDVYAELKTHCAALTPDNQLQGTLDLESLPEITANLMRVGNVPIYATDMLVRHSLALQQTPLAEVLAVHVNPQQAEQLQLNAGDRVRIRQEETEAEASVIVDDAVAMGCVRIPAAVAGSEILGIAMGAVTLERL